MIKSLLDTDEEPLPEKKLFTKENLIDEQQINEDISEMSEFEKSAEAEDQRGIFEIPEDARFFAKPTENINADEQTQTTFEIKTPSVESQKEENSFGEPNSIVEEKPFENVEAEPEKVVETPSARDEQPMMFQTNYTPENTGETVRNSGLAYSAAIVLFASIVFMMILGWFVGQLIGNSTGGIVGGIILGAIIGFIQFFRITSSIFKK